MTICHELVASVFSFIVTEEDLHLDSVLRQNIRNQVLEYSDLLRFAFDEKDPCISSHSAYIGDEVPAAAFGPHSEWSAYI